MRVDITVPNFDNTSDEVTLSSWYKNVGDKISKNEIIADAETMSVACGITSSYECILVKILAPEGAVISQGTKIAVIETDLNADISDIIRNAEAEAARVMSDIVGAEIQEEIFEEELKSPEFSDSSDRGYSLSVPLNEDISVRKVEKKVEKIVEEEIIEEEIIEEEIIEEKVEEKLEEIRAEAEKLREKILEEARREALIQAEELKAKIITESEKKAAKEAEKIHKKMIEETEHKKAKLMGEAEAQALKQAEAVKNEIINNAEKEAKFEAESKISLVKKEAEETAELLSKEIIGEAIHKSKTIKGDIYAAHKNSENQAVKNSEEEKRNSHFNTEDFIESVAPQAFQDTESLKKEVLKIANEEINEKTRSILNSVVSEINKKMGLDIHNVMDGAQKNAYDEIRQSAGAMLHSIVTKVNREMGRDICDVVDNARKNACTEICETMYPMINSVITEINKKMEDEIYEVVEEVRKSACDDIRGIAHSMLNRVVTEINGKMERDVHGVVDDARRNAYNEIRVSIEKIVSDIKNEIVEKTSGEMLHFAVSEIDKNISGNIHRVIKDECYRHKRKKIDDDFSEREKPDRRGETMTKNNFSTEKQAKIIEKLLRADQKDTRSEIYADNWNKPKFFETPGDRSEPVDMLRRRILEKMKDSYDTSVISTVSNEVDMSAILALEKIFGSAFSKKHNTRLGFTPFFISASIAALKQYRIFNSHILNNEIIYKNYFDISIITCGNDGIAAPVIRNADILTIAEIERAMIHLSKRAVEGTLSVEEVSGGTFTVVNAGIYGSLIGTDLLTPPQVATLSVHKMNNRPVATDKGVEVKPMLYISLSYDHRVSDTGKASEFLSNIKNYVENPGWQILGLSEV